MNIRLIAGAYGGRKLRAPTTGATHPMGERIRGSLFNILGDRLQSAEVLDAFAGTGALGFEALSRGAKTAVFLERNKAAAEVLRRNKTTLGLNNEKAIVMQTAVGNWEQANSEHLFDIIFCDPPYDDLQFSTVKKLFSHLKVNGLMVLSHPGRSETPTDYGVVVVDNRRFGDATLTFYHMEK